MLVPKKVRQGRLGIEHGLVHCWQPVDDLRAVSTCGEPPAAPLDWPPRISLVKKLGEPVVTVRAFLDIDEGGSRPDSTSGRGR